MLEFAALPLDAAQDDRLRLPLAAVGALLEARPDAGAVLVEFDVLTDPDGGIRVVQEWSLVHPHDQRSAPAADIIELELWASCWAIQRFPFDHLLLDLLGGEPGSRGAAALDRLAAGALLLWPEGAVFLEDRLMLVTADAPGRIRPLVSDADRAQANFAARLWRRLKDTIPVTPED